MKGHLTSSRNTTHVHIIYRASRVGKAAQMSPVLSSRTHDMARTRDTTNCGGMCSGISSGLIGGLLHCDLRSALG